MAFFKQAAAHLASMTLLVSLFLHLIIIKFTVLTFRAAPAAFKPHYVFLGSILENRNFSDLAEHKATTAFKESSIPVPYSQSYFNPTKITTVIKPNYPLLAGKENKNFIKATFLEETEGPKDSSGKLEADLYLPPIVPFRLHIRPW